LCSLITVFSVVRVISVQLGDELDHVKLELEERGNSMSDGGHVLLTLVLLCLINPVYSAFEFLFVSK